MERITVYYKLLIYLASDKKNKKSWIDSFYGGMWG